MLTRVEKAQQKWGGSHTVIDKWLNERQDLIVLYCKIAGFTPYEKQDQALPEPKLIESFCQLLMDYLSAGHHSHCSRTGAHRGGFQCSGVGQRSGFGPG